MKKILALAIASAFAAPAFAATSNVDIYGKLHLSLNFYNDQVTTVEDMGISSNASRIGFKGAEDLGGGLSAIWQLETGVNMDEGTGTTGAAAGWATRNSFVGLKGGFGTALIGKHDTPLKLVGRPVDLFGDTLADSRNVMGFGSDTRANNVAVYMSPSMSGFQVAAAYSTDVAGTGNDGDGIDKDAYNLSATYTNGPIYLGLGYGDGDYHESADLGSQWSLAGGYNFGNFRIVGQYMSLEDNTSAVGNGDYDAWMVGGAFTMGAMVFKANYMDGDYDVSTSDPTQWTIGVDYNLSKRTQVYALYADGEFVNLGNHGGSSDRVSTGVVGGDISVISLGVVHTF